MAFYSMRLVYLTFISSVMSMDISTYLLRYWIAVTILYHRYRTRFVKYYRGMVVAMPLYSLIFMVLILSNTSIPLSCGFVGEFLSLLGIYCFTGLFRYCIVRWLLVYGYREGVQGWFPVERKNNGHEK